MKYIYAGTPEFAVEPLKQLILSGYEVVCVVTQEDKPQGRKNILTPSPVKAYALEQGIPVFQPHKIREHVEELLSFGADAMITCAYGQILTQDVLDVFPKGVWNIHAGLLPAYRGASPIQSCILNGETETGVCFMKTELGLDSGDVLVCKKTEILPTETYGELSERLSVIGSEAMLSGLALVEKGDFSSLQKQGEEGVKIYKKIDKDAGKLDFSMPVKTLVNTVRAYNPEPCAYTGLNGVRINIFRAEEYTCDEEGTIGEVLFDSPKKGLVVQCGDGKIRLTEVQMSGGKKMSGGDFLNGRKAKKGDIFQW